MLTTSEILVYCYHALRMPQPFFQIPFPLDDLRLCHRTPPRAYFWVSGFSPLCVDFRLWFIGLGIDID